MRRRASGTSALAAALTVATLGWPAPSGAMPTPVPAKVTARGLTVVAKLGSYCVSNPEEGVTQCVDAFPGEPGPRHRLPLAPGTPITFQFGDRPQLRDEVISAKGTLLRFDDDGRAEPVGRLEIVGSGERWAAKAPKKLHRANALSLFTRLEGGGDVSQVVGLKSSRRQPLRCPGEVGVAVRAAEIRGLDIDEATALAKRRGCALRVVRIDGVAQAVTDDLSLDRVNVIVRASSVVGVDGIY